MEGHPLWSTVWLQKPSFRIPRTSLTLPTTTVTLRTIESPISGGQQSKRTWLTQQSTEQEFKERRTSGQSSLRETYTTSGPASLGGVRESSQTHGNWLTNTASVSTPFMTPVTLTGSGSK